MVAHRVKLIGIQPRLIRFGQALLQLQIKYLKAEPLRRLELLLVYCQAAEIGSLAPCGGKDTSPQPGIAHSSIHFFLFTRHGTGAKRDTVPQSYYIPPPFQVWKERFNTKTNRIAKKTPQTHLKICENLRNLRLKLLHPLGNHP